MTPTPATTPARLRVYLVKPSKYGDDGQVLSFWKGILPSNTLSVLQALVLAWNDHRPPGLSTRTEAVLWDELVHGPVDEAFAARLQAEAREPGTALAVFVCGAQTNEYSRARDVAVWLRQLGFPVLIGGFHITGHAASREFLQAAGVSTVSGEAEATLGLILADLLHGRLQPHYEPTSGIRAKTGKDPIWVPPIEDAPLPAIDRGYLARMMQPKMTTLDTSRGCPFTCSYCSVKNVMGRTMRARDPRAIQEWVREAYDRHGIRYLFLVDDDFYRNPRWEEVLDGFIALRRSGRQVGFMMQVDVEASGGLAREGGEREAQTRRFLEKSAAAGCYQVFVGFESFNPSNLEAASKHQNRTLAQPEDPEAARQGIVEKYRRVVSNWHSVGVGVHGAGMIGFPWDGPDTGRRMAEDFIAIRLDQASFFIVTPLPGTEDWDQAIAERRVVDFDFDHYETTRPVTRHPLLTREQLLTAYHEAVDTFYHPRRLVTYLATHGWNRSLSPEARNNNVRQFAWYFFSRLRRRHPMIGGFWKRRSLDLKTLFAARTSRPSPALPQLSHALAELRRWRAEAQSASGSLSARAEALTSALGHALSGLGRHPVVEDQEGAKALAYLVPHLEALRHEARQLVESGAHSLQALAELVDVRLTRLWREAQARGAHEAHLLEQLLREIQLRVGPLPSPA